MAAQASLIEDGRLNPGYLKLDLFCKGLRVADGCLDGGRGPVRMRSGLGSGLELRIPGREHIHVNVPVVEPFAQQSPYELRRGPRSGWHLSYDGSPLTAVHLPERPRFYDLPTSSGKRMDTIGVLQGTYLGVYYGTLCANWKDPALDVCRFCSVGDNVLEGKERTGKSVQDVVETALAAKRELGITFVHVNGGFDDRLDYLQRFVPLMRALREETGLLTGLQIPPLTSIEDYRVFAALGVNNVSLCYEIWDPDRFHEVCPGKDRRAGLDVFKQALMWCAQDVGFDTTNGEMIAGLEPVQSSMAAVDWLTSVGAVPTICVFRPVVGTPYADLPPPDTEDLIPLFGHAWHRCMERGLPIGIAPNVHVSIVLNPEEWRWLAPPAERGHHRLARARLAAKRSAFRTWFRLRHRRVRSDGA